MHSYVQGIMIKMIEADTLLVLWEGVLFGNYVYYLRVAKKL